IAATNRDLEDDVRAGKFRSDLFHRLTQLQLRVPPLRERADDILALAEYFLQQNAPGARFAEEAKHCLLGYHWPGNVRELRNVVLKAAVQSKSGSDIRARDLPAAICGVPEASSNVAMTGNLEDMERQMIFQALAQNSGSQAKAAQQLGISGRTLRRKLAKYQRDEANAGAPALGRLSAHQQRYFRVTIEMPISLMVDGKKIEAK